MVALVTTLTSVLLMLGTVARVSSQAPDNLTIAISPQLLDITANPGETISNVFRLTNVSETSIDIKTTPKNFTPRGEEGAVDLTEDDTSYSLAKWISVDPEMTTIQANKTHDFTVEINVPDDAEPGSHFGSVVFQTIPPEQEGTAALVSQEIAPVILVRIAGDTTESAEIVEFTTNKNFYSNEKTITFTSRIKNTGNVHFKPVGTIVVKDMFGNEVANIELDEKNVLPDSVRQFSSEWLPDGVLIGNYTATLTIVSGDNNSIQTLETSFFAFPYQIILPVLVGLIILIVIIYKGRSRIKKAARALSGKDEA